MFKIDFPWWSSDHFWAIPGNLHCFGLTVSPYLVKLRIFFLPKMKCNVAVPFCDHKLYFTVSKLSFIALRSWSNWNEPEKETLHYFPWAVLIWKILQQRAVATNVHPLPRLVKGDNLLQSLIAVLFSQEITEFFMNMVFYMCHFVIVFRRHYVILFNVCTWNRIT